MKCKNGFTLAEVLITLGVIGIVAALTMPTLITKHQKNVAINQLKKAQNTLERAVNLSYAHNGTADEWNWTLETNDFVKLYLLPYIKIAEDCGISEEVTKCTIESKRYNGSNNGFIALMYYIVTSDGTKIGLRNDGGSIQYQFDTNGNKGPNTVGKDIFIGYYSFDENKRFIARLDGLHPWNPFGNDYETLKNNPLYGCNKTAMYAGSWCGGVIQYNNWQIPDDYPW